jgi:hypothetical protein
MKLYQDFDVLVGCQKGSQPRSVYKVAKSKVKNKSVLWVEAQGSMPIPPCHSMRLSFL